MRRESPTRLLRAAVGTAIIALAVWTARDHASDFTLRPLHMRFQPLAILATVGFLLASFACFAASWWVIARGWRQGVSLRSAIRAWSLTNLARYRPTHGHAIDQMSKLARDAGVSPSFAVGAAVLPRLVTLAAATAVASGLYVLNQMEADVVSITLGCSLVAAAIASAVLLTSSGVVFRISVAIHRPNAIQPLEPDALGASTLFDIAGFLVQGLALQYLAIGVLVVPDLTWWVATGSVGAAYVVGRLVPVLPSGFPVREAVLFLLLWNTVGMPPALVLALIWRVVLTLTEVGAAFPFLPNRSNTSDAS